MLHYSMGKRPRKNSRGSGKSRQRIVEEEGRVAVWDSRKGSFWNEYGRRELSKHRLCKREAHVSLSMRGEKARASLFIRGKRHV